MSTIRIVTLLFCGVAVAVGAGHYPLEGLLPRAEHVLVVDLVSRTGSNATFEVREVLRGDTSLKTLVLSHTHAEHEFPKDTKTLLLFSQGDDFHGPPKAEFRVGQPIAGQASYRGWLLGEADVRSPQGRKQLLALMEHIPYRADIYGKKSNHAVEPTRAPAGARGSP